MVLTCSPLRYPGGKSQFYSRLVRILSDNGIGDMVYLEPFAGGAGVAVKLLLEGKASRLVINDADLSIYAFWRTAIWDADWLVWKIESTPITIETWHVQKSVFSSPKSSIRDRGFATLFLNRTNRSGILKAGPIGGKKQNGKYTLDCRFNKNAIIERIRAVSLRKEQIVLENLDAKDFIDKYKGTVGGFWFIDPPYYRKGAELYQNYYTHEDHLALSRQIRLLLNNAYWLLTYDDCDSIADAYSWAPSMKLSMEYSAQVKRKEQELLFWNRLIIQ